MEHEYEYYMVRTKYNYITEHSNKYIGGKNYVERLRKSNCQIPATRIYESAHGAIFMPDSGDVVIPLSNTMKILCGVE